MMLFSDIKKFCLTSQPKCTRIFRGNDNWSAYLNERNITTYRMTGETQVSFWLQQPNGTIIYYCPSYPPQGMSMFYFENELPGPLHRHDFLELGYVIEGDAVQLFSGQEYIFPTGSFWLSDRSCVHQDVYLRKNLFTIFFNFSNNLFDQSFMNLLDDKGLREFMHNALVEQRKMRQFLSFIPRHTCPEIQPLLEQMANEVTHRGVGWEMVLRGLLARLFSILLQNFDIELTNQKKIWSSQLLYSEITRYIQENYTSVTLQSLSQLYHYTPDFLSRLIKENCGLSYSEYIQFVRVEKACGLLENSSEPIDEIIEKVGYHNKRFFYRIFRELMEMTPKEYRKRRQNQ